MTISNPQPRWYSNGEILLPPLQGLCAMWSIGIARRMFDWPIGVDALGLLAGVAGMIVFVYRFFATKPDKQH
jgi:hypothetical protein